MAFASGADAAVVKSSKEIVASLHIYVHHFSCTL
uniref:Uncharacterized protein n=1 Tax=Arundo donax TaxID=35708 RepID=A0A0A9C7U3_ARUDO